MQDYEELENELTDRFDLPRGNLVCCSSGTAALHLALEAFQIPNLGSRQVIIPDYCMYACARAVTLAGLRPVTVDCKRRDLLIDAERIEEAVKQKTCAIIAVHNYGRLCDMDAISDIACDNELLIIEDMAEAHGCKVHPDSDVACWSFYKNKIIAGEEGGAVYYKDRSVADYARKLRNLGFNEPHDYSHVPRGHNYRLSNCHAKMIRISNWGYPHNLVLRRQIEKWYDWVCPEQWRMPDRQAPWVYDIRLHGISEMTQNRLIDLLRAEGIQARHGFLPISMQEEYKHSVSVGVEALLARREIIYLPIEPGVTTQEKCERTFEMLKKWYPV